MVGVGLDGFGDTEVGYFDPAVWLHHHVGWFDIAMHEALLVGVSESIGRLRRNIHRLFDAQVALTHDSTQGSTGYQFHDDVSALTTIGMIHTGVVYGNDRGVVEAGRGNCFTTEAGDKAGIGGKMWIQDLGGYGTIQDFVMCFPHLGHAAAGEGTQQAIAVAQPVSYGADTGGWPVFGIGSRSDIGGDERDLRLATAHEAWSASQHHDWTGRLNVRPMTPGPPWVPMTAPIWPTRMLRRG